MKKILLLLVLIISMASHSQDSLKYKFKLKEHIAPVALVFMAGCADGLRDATIYHNDRVLDKLNANEKFWGSQSWRNKYKNFDPAQGRRFPGSTTWLVFVTDAPHALKFADNLFTSGAIAIKFTQKKKKFIYYVLEGIGYWVVNRIGFSAVYYRF